MKKFTKTTKTILMGMFLLFGIHITLNAQDANLTLSNFNTYYDHYDNSTKLISGIYIEVGADGNNSNNYIISDFETSLYLLPCDASGTPTSSTPVIIAVYILTGGTLHQMGTYTWSNYTVDLSQVPGLTNGMYRMGAWVNSNAGGNGISDPPDYQSDNAGLMMSNSGTSSGSVINFSSSSGIQTNPDIVSLFDNYPNPASVLTAIRFKFISQPKNSSIRIYNMVGDMIQEIGIDKNDKVEFPVGNLNPGVYFYSLVADGKVVAMNKLTVTH